MHIYLTIWIVLEIALDEDQVRGIIGIFDEGMNPLILYSDLGWY